MKKMVIVFSLLTLIFLSASSVLAQAEINTAIGKIDVENPKSFVESILTLAIGIGGGIATLLIIFGGFQVLTSSGNPEKVQAGKEMITSAITGLLLIVFAVFILRIIGVEILGIKGFE